MENPYDTAMSSYTIHLRAATSHVYLLAREALSARWRLGGIFGPLVTWGHLQPAGDLGASSARWRLGGVFGPLETWGRLARLETWGQHRPRETFVHFLLHMSLYFLLDVL